MYLDNKKKRSRKPVSVPAEDHNIGNPALIVALCAYPKV
jgi:hypothetical protein